ncbi:hypothetical protein PGT21_005500 [Puccinia graminis f. sp. tritici]|uniref:Extracellular membrane protein CFEM domain-containing protein n=1 Tax=Puccinia graminis f. sp. tritici TaxID=56615 RepID=A0A5B0P0U1_PUCGR|nr:hypothetical protein PGT21_005500 [Puccinia graminis f. sp. tritici]KAA1093609.1 hypothetical protein PGTUg99_007839 [Puccinia graminis f. sp. tritici]
MKSIRTIAIYVFTLIFFIGHAAAECTRHHKYYLCAYGDLWVPPLSDQCPKDSKAECCANDLATDLAAQVDCVPYS